MGYCKMEKLYILVRSTIRTGKAKPMDDVMSYTLKRTMVGECGGVLRCSLRRLEVLKQEILGVDHRL